MNQNFKDAMAKALGIDSETQEILDNGSNHPYGCTCEICRLWWQKMGPEDIDRPYGNFTIEQIEDDTSDGDNCRRIRLQLKEEIELSVSTDAILFYGIPLEEDTPVSLEGVVGSVANNHEINDDWAHLKHPPEPKSADYQNAEWDTWREQLNDYEKSIQHVEIGIHCSLDYPMYYLHGRQFIAYRGDVDEIDPAQLITTPEEDAVIREFCERYGIPYKQPKWYLVSCQG
jgi:hypothetical protein